VSSTSDEGANLEGDWCSASSHFVLGEEELSNSVDTGWVYIAEDNSNKTMKGSLTLFGKSEDGSLA
jgi:hypothetical protein